jgi:hypothetical protein
VSVEVQGAGDGVTLAWEPAGCPTQRRASKSRYAETCTLPRPATLLVENPTALFGDDCRVRVRWTGVAGVE